MANPKSTILTNPPKALTFDVFGTTVNWRTTITSTLIHSASTHSTSSSLSASLPHAVRLQLSRMTPAHWSDFAQQWRNSYKTFVKSYNPDTDPWVDIDTHHLRSLKSLLQTWGLTGLYTEDELSDLSLTWHFLEPYADTSRGIALLNRKFITSTLSNGNQSLLQDLQDHGNLGFAKLQSSEDFRAYKPHPRTYLGAARVLGCKAEEGEVAMVACHLSDLQAAAGLGFRTVYVEREREEDWEVGGEDYEAARGWVDLWVKEGEGGFVGVAKAFGIE